jgi:hypothetical protein
MARIQKEFQRCAGESLGYAHELTRVFASLQEHGVPALPFKGPLLAQQLYQKLSLRQCSDLDIYIEKSQFKDAITALESIGYTPIWPQDSPSIFKADKHILLIATAGGFKVELHWSLALPGAQFVLPFRDLWSRREQVSILGSAIPVPAKEDMLLILCFHAATHCWGSLKWICDIGELIKGDSNLNWKLLLTHARQRGCRRILFIGTALARDILAIALPEILEREMSTDKPMARTRNEVLRRFFTGTLPPQCVERPLTYIRSRERLWDRLQLVTRFVSRRLKPNERDREWMQLPESLGILYIFLRIIRIAYLRYKVSVIPLLKAIFSA